MRVGPQREIFPGGTKIDTGPPKLGEEQTNKSQKGLHSNLVLDPVPGTMYPLNPLS